MVGVEVRTYLWMNTTGTLAFLTCLDITPFHAIHIRGGTTEVGEIAFEVGHLNDLSDLFENTLFRAAGDKLTLMGRDGTECTTAKASAVDIDAVFDHLVGRNTLTLVFRMWLTGIGQVEGSIQLRCRHRRIGWVHDHI